MRIMINIPEDDCQRFIKTLNKIALDAEGNADRHERELCEKLAKALENAEIVSAENNIRKTGYLSRITVEEFTLLTAEEFRAGQKYIKPVDGKWWWLKTPGLTQYDVKCVDLWGNVYASGISINNPLTYVRPVMRFRTEEPLDPGETVVFGGYDWTVIAPGLALSDTLFCRMSYRQDTRVAYTNKYSTSDIREYLDGKFAEMTGGNTAKTLDVFVRYAA